MVEGSKVLHFSNTQGPSARKKYQISNFQLTNFKHNQASYPTLHFHKVVFSCPGFLCFMHDVLRLFKNNKKPQLSINFSFFVQFLNQVEVPAKCFKNKNKIYISGCEKKKYMQSTEDKNIIIFSDIFIIYETPNIYKSVLLINT